MTSVPHTVNAELELRLVIPGSTAVPVLASVRYEVADPYAVHVVFHTGGDRGTVEWSFARSLLTEGIGRAVGDGDVRVWPTRVNTVPTVCLALTSPSGSAIFEVEQSELVEFLTRSYVAVPTGCEGDFIDVDAELALLLWEGDDAPSS